MQGGLENATTGLPQAVQPLAPRTRSTGRRDLVVLTIAAMLIVAIVYWPVLSARAFYFDDDQYLFDNRLVQNPGWQSAGRFLSEVLQPSTVEGYYQPLTMISLMLDYQLGGRRDEPRQFRRTSLLLHAVNTGLVILLLYQLFGQPLPAALVGLLFGLHPAGVESVAWLAQRKNLLSMTFGLLCLLSYLRFARTGGLGVYVLCGATFVLALLAKPIVVALPILMILLDYWPLRRLSASTISSRLLEKIPLLIIGAVFAVITIKSQHNTAGYGVERTLLQVLLVTCHNVVFYLGKLIWPANLCAFYPFPEPLGLSHLALRIGLIGTAILLALLALSWRWTRSLVTGWLFFFLAVFPTLGAVGFTVAIAADRFVYFPMIGLLLPLAALLGWSWCVPIAAQRRLAIQVAVVVLLLGVTTAYSFATRHQLANWRDDESIYGSVLAKSDRIHQAHTNLAHALLAQERFAEAILHYRRALELKPDDVSGHYNLGWALSVPGSFDEAVKQLREAIRIDDEHAEAHGQLGVVLFRLGQVEQAQEHCRRAVELAPEDPEIVFNLGLLLAKQGQFNEAIDVLQRAISLDPNYAEAHCALAGAYLQQDRHQQAIPHARKALMIAKTQKPAAQLASIACRTLGRALVKAGEYRQAADLFRERLASVPGDMRACHDLAWLLATCPDNELRDGASALRLAERVCEATKFESVKAVDALAAAYAEVGRFEEAAATARRAIELASAAGKIKLTEAITARLKLYESREPFRQQ